MKVPFFSGKKISISLHILAWMIFFILPIYLLYIDSSNDTHFIEFAYIQTIGYALIFYINFFYLVPKFFFIKKRRIYYFISALVLITCISYGISASISNDFPGKKDRPEKGEMLKLLKKGERPKPPYNFEKMGEVPPKPSKNWPLYNYFLTSFLISGFALGLRFSDKMLQNEKKRKEAEKEKLNSELAFLKNQISPHFFFNTLNNIYSLVQINTVDASKSLLQLSKLMRYLIYDSEKENTKLSQELEFITNYINLMKLRISPKVRISATFPVSYPDVVFPPLLFVPFIENAFKHGVSYQEASFIDIRMEIENNEIIFSCSNSIGFKTNNDESSDPGIGLENVKKRLALLFPEKHVLTIDKTTNTFNVLLLINTAK
jgi:two-component system, LytTR family, sensor kinase